MDLRPRKRQSLSGFTDYEIQRMDSILRDSKANVLDKDFCKKLARAFNRSNGRTRQPVVTWMEIQNWLRNRQKICLDKDTPANASKVLPDVPESHPSDKEKQTSNIQKVLSSAEKALDLSKLEFEARSSKDGAWYDIDSFISHRYLSSGDAEVLVRFIGFGEEEDEWVNIRKSVRERSIGLEDSECDKVIVGDSVLCFQEKKDLARYFEARVTEIQRRLHDIRGCRCLFVIQYAHDNTQETVRLKRLCFRPGILVRQPET